MSAIGDELVTLEQFKRAVSVGSGLRESNDQLAQQSAALAAGIEESKARSRGMGDDVSRIRATTDHTAEQVEDIHRHLFREGTD